MSFDFLAIPEQILGNMNVLWAYILFNVRFVGLLAFIPGIGMGVQGLTVRAPAIIVLAFTALLGSNVLPPVPNDWLTFIVQVFSEFTFGLVLGFIPNMIVIGVQTGAQLASTTMGLQAGNLIDPTMQTNVSDLGRIYGDLTIILFLFMGGHHILVYAASQLPPAGFLLGGNTLNLLIDQCGAIFRLGMMVSAPVVVALLLTNFVMGLITKAVPTINVFIVSFPLTIGIGLALSLLLLPELVTFVLQHFQSVDGSVHTVMQDTAS